MPRVFDQVRSGARPGGGAIGYPPERLFEEIAYVAFHFHWPYHEIMNLDHLERARWDFVEGWPTKWTGPSFNATGNEVAIETLELAHEGIDRKS